MLKKATLAAALLLATAIPSSACSSARAGFFRARPAVAVRVGRVRVFGGGGFLARATFRPQPLFLFR